MTPQTAIDAVQLTKVFTDFWRRPKVTAVSDLSFSVARGEIFGLLGPNGSGKSTTIKLMLGLLHPTRGHIHVLDHRPSDVQVKKLIGYLPEESYQYPSLSALESLDFYGRLFNLPAARRKKRTEELLELVGLTHDARRRVGEFSKGMARRLGLAQALINDPELLILDEPTSGLDPIGCREVKNLILALGARGKTILMTSHLLADVEDVCGRIAILHHGHLKAIGRVDELLEERSAFRIVLPSSASRAHAETLAKNAAALIGADATLEHPRRNLEEFFLQTVGRSGKKDAS